MLYRFSCTALLASCGLLGVTAPTTLASEEADRSQPNIIFIMADDLGYGELGCYGQEKIKTPSIDSIAKQGIRFTQAYAGSMVCQPSRCVLMTGLHSGHAAVRANDVDQLLYDEDVTIAEVLKDAGYTTGAFGKWGLGYEGTPGHPNRQGFDQFFGQLLQVHAHFYYPYWVWKNEIKYPLPGNENGKREQYVHDEIHRQAVEFIRQNHKGPFFAYIPYIIPHVELVVPEESEQPYRGQFPKREIIDPRPGYIGSEDGLTTFAGMVSRMDRDVGEILRLLDELGIADNTLVFFTSDNGGQNGGKDNGWTQMTDYFKGNGPLRGYKGTFYEGGIRVPLIARWPKKIQAGAVTDHMCGFQDVLPTLAEIAGGKPPQPLDGISFAPTLLGKKDEQKQHEHLYWEYPRGNRRQQALRAGNWKAVQGRPNGPVELYDLATDIGEQNNLAKQHPDIVEKLIAIMDREHRPLRDYPPAPGRTGVKDYVR